MDKFTEEPVKSAGGVNLKATNMREVDDLYAEFNRISYEHFLTNNEMPQYFVPFRTSKF
ncbi:MAG: hypothetical protein ACI91Z_002138 [Yoonia sp.]